MIYFGGRNNKSIRKEFGTDLFVYGLHTLLTMTLPLSPSRLPQRTNASATILCLLMVSFRSRIHCYSSCRCSSVGRGRAGKALSVANINEQKRFCWTPCCRVLRCPIKRPPPPAPSTSCAEHQTLFIKENDAVQRGVLRFAAADVALLLLFLHPRPPPRRLSIHCLLLCNMSIDFEQQKCIWKINN